MDDLEDGEICDSSSDNEKGSGSVVYQVVERPSVPATAMRSLPPAKAPSPPKYRSCPGINHSSSESDTDEEENTALWRQKQNKYFRNQKDGTAATSSSPSLPEYRQTRPQNSAGSGDSSQPGGKKKVNNIWGSVIQEQDLTQTLVKSGTVKHIDDLTYKERTVESYDFTNKYNDSRPEVDELEAGKETEIHDPFEKVISTASEKSRPDRSIIDYEDSMDMEKRKKNRNRNNRKRKRDHSDDKMGSVHDRLGAKKQATTRLGPIDISVDMDEEVIVKKIADFLNEPKIELIERVMQSLGKEVAIRILNMTRDVEEAGGLLTVDGSRRRTAGGVYLQMLKQQPECTTASKKIIFQEDYMERQKDKKEIQKRKREQRKRVKKRQERFQEDREGKPENSAQSKSRSSSPATREDDSDGELDDGYNDGRRLKGHNSSTREPQSFQDELAAAKELILSKSRSREAEDMEADVGEEMKVEDKENLEDVNDLEEAGANVVDIDFGDTLE